MASSVVTVTGLSPWRCRGSPLQKAKLQNKAFGILSYFGRVQ